MAHSKNLRDVAARLELKSSEAARIKFEEMCDKERDEAFAAMTKNQEEYDKQLLTLSSAFLLLSLAFVKDIVPVDHAIFRGLLYASFIALGCCIALVLLSYQISIFVHDKAKKYWEKQKANEHVDFPFKMAERVQYLNWANGVIFLIGVALCICFVIINFHMDVTSMKKTPIIANDGLNVKVPSPSDTFNKGLNVKVPASPSKPTQQPTGNTKK
ncbi:MAG: hypothetical protein JSS95_03890 [Acidobacteria bacterium]|nr:hypothetical protein [Acidobacteriota bacterium]